MEKLGAHTDKQLFIISKKNFINLLRKIITNKLRLLTTCALFTTIMFMTLSFMYTPSQDAHATTATGTTDANLLVNTLIGNGGSGIVPSSVSATLSGHSSGDATSSGTYVNPSGTYGMVDGIVLSSGNVNDYNDGPNTVSSKTTIYGVPATAAQELLLDPITGGSWYHYDVTQLDVTFDMQPGYDTVYFNVVFGSEEFPEYVGTPFIDGFGLYVNGENIAFVNGQPVNINHPSMDFIPGTELDGILTDPIEDSYVHTFSALVGDGSTGNTLTFIVSDASDYILDTTVYISQLGGEAPEPIPQLEVPTNMAPDCTGAIASANPIWPPNHKMRDITIKAVADPNGDDITITINSIYQDEEVSGKGSGNSSPDGAGVGTDTAQIRAEKSGKGDGRVYHIGFTADDGELTCSGVVTVGVPHDQRGTDAVDQGPLYDSTESDQNVLSEEIISDDVQVVSNADTGISLLQDAIVKLSSLSDVEIQNLETEVSYAAQLYKYLAKASKEDKHAFQDLFHEYKDLVKEKLGIGQGAQEKIILGDLEKADLKLQIQNSKDEFANLQNDKINNAIKLKNMKETIQQIKNKIGITVSDVTINKGITLQNLQKDELKLLKYVLKQEAKSNGKELTPDDIKEIENKAESKSSKSNSQNGNGDKDSNKNNKGKSDNKGKSSSKGGKGKSK